MTGPTDPDYEVPTSFMQFLRDMAEDSERMARRPRCWWLTTDERRVEVQEVLWRLHEYVLSGHPPQRPVTLLAWTLWTRREVDLIRQRVRCRDDAMEVPDHVSLTVDLRPSQSALTTADLDLDTVIDALATVDPEASTVARLLAEGHSPADVMALLGLTRHRYYGIRDRLQGMLGDLAA